MTISMYADEIVSERKSIRKTRADGLYFCRLARRFLIDTNLVLRCWRERNFVYCDNCYQEITDHEINIKLRQWLMEKAIAHNNNVVGNILPVIRAMRYVLAEVELPAYLGKAEHSDLDPAWTIPFRNGLLDVRRYMDGRPELISHSPHWFSTAVLPYDFDLDARCERWIAFLREVYEDDEDRIALLQEFMGYTLVANTSHQKLLILHGVAGSGKSTILHAWQHLLGEANTTGYHLERFASAFGLADLIGKQVAFVGEVNLTQNPKKYFIMATLNRIVGEDPLTVEEKFRASVSLRLPTRFVIACNELPEWYDDSGALQRRLLILNHQQSFVGREDHELKVKLLADLPGILVWALDGLARLRKYGSFTLPALTRKSLAKSAREASPTLAFIQDCCRVNQLYVSGNFTGVEITEASCQVAKAVLYNHFCSWAQDHGESATQGWFFKNLYKVLPKLDEQRLRDGDRRVYTTIGLALK